MAKVKDTGPAESAPQEEKPTATFDYEVAVKFAKQIEEIQVEIDNVMAVAKEETAPMRERIENMLKEAGEAGCTRKVIKHVLSDRRSVRRREAAFAKLSGEHQAQAKQLAFDLEASRVPTEETEEA